MVWACFLHFYQPPTQKKYWIDRVTDECYRRIINGLLENPQAKITLNINSILCELWDEHGHHDVLSGLKTLVERGQIELTGSAKYHPLLPKLPKEMVVRQIVLNEITLNKYFGVAGPVLRNSKFKTLNSKQTQNPNDQKSKSFEFENFGNSNLFSTSNLELSASGKPLRGFFPPEMAYNRYLAEIVASLGYEWIITEELSLGKPVEYNRVYTISGVPVKESPLQVGKGDSLSSRELMIFFRDRAFSYKVLAGYLGTEKLFLDDLRNKFPEEQHYNDATFQVNPTSQPHLEGVNNDLSHRSDDKGHFLLTAMDGETFGHHRPGMEKLLFDLFKISSIKMVHISDLPLLFPGRESIETVPSTWALMEHEVEKNLPFARWDDPENEVHRLQWELTNFAMAVVGNSKPKTLSSKQISAQGGSASGGQNSNEKNSRDFGSNNLESFRISDLEFSVSDPNEVGGSDLTQEQKKLLKAQLLLDRALHSDQYWWASAKPWWSIEYIELGAKELLDAIRATGDKEALDQAQDLYYRILETAFEYQRSGKVDEISRKEDETIRMRTDQTLPKMPKEELLKIIATIRKEMLDVVSRLEYERAAQLRDRIRELESYLNPKF